MKKYLLFLVSIFVLTKVSLFAFDDSYLKMNDSKWNHQSGKDPLTQIFILKDYEPEDPKKPVLPNIVIKITPSTDKYQYWKGDKESLNKYKKLMEDSFQEVQNKMKNSIKNNIKKNIPNISDSKINEIIENELGESSMSGITTKRINGHNAISSDYQIGFFKFRVITIVTLVRDYSIVVTYGEDIDIDTLPAYKEFMQSLELKDRKATYFNAFFFANIYWIIFGGIAILRGLYELYKRFKNN